MNPRLVPVLSLLAFVLADDAPSQRIFVVDAAADAILEFNGTTGALVDAQLMDLQTMTNGALDDPLEIVRVLNGELWVSDPMAQSIFRFTDDGSMFVDSTSATLNSPRGLAAAQNAAAFVATDNVSAPGVAGSLVQVDGGGQATVVVPALAPGDVEPFVLAGTRGFLATNSLLDTVTFYEAANLANTSVFAPSVGGASFGLPQQVHVGLSGNVYLVRQVIGTGIYEYDPSGNLVNFIDTIAIAGLANPRGVAELVNGNLLFTSAAGVHLYDRPTNSISTELPGNSPWFCTVLNPPGQITSGNYCASVPTRRACQGSCQRSVRRWSCPTTSRS